MKVKKIYLFIPMFLLILSAPLSNSLRITPIAPPHNDVLTTNRSPASSPLSDARIRAACENAYQTVCKAPGITRDPTGYVTPDIDGEKQVGKMFKEIIHAHRDWNIDQVHEELAQRIFEPKKRARILSAFNWVKTAINQFIDEQDESVFTPFEKFQIKFRIAKTRLQLPPPAKVYEDEPDIFTRNEAYYERLSDGRTRLRVGGAYVFIARSWFNLVFTFAHELGHAIDPCEIRSIHLSLPAYDRLEACFLQSHLVTTFRDRNECGENDQLSEVFADWLAAQITSRALKHYQTEFDEKQILKSAINSVRDLCDQGTPAEDIDLRFHPAPRVRIEMIFGQNPQIQAILGCKPKLDTPAYCTFKGPIETHEGNRETHQK